MKSAVKLAAETAKMKVAFAAHGVMRVTQLDSFHGEFCSDGV